MSLKQCPFYALAGKSGEKFNYLVVDEFMYESLAHNTPIGSWDRAIPKCWWCLARNIPLAAMTRRPCVLLLLYMMLWSLVVNSNRQLSLLLLDMAVYMRLFFNTWRWNIIFKLVWTILLWLTLLIPASQHYIWWYNILIVTPLNTLSIVAAKLCLSSLLWQNSLVCISTISYPRLW